MMKRKIIIFAAIAVVIVAGLIAYMVQQGWFIDETARVDKPIAHPVRDVEPVLEVVAEDLGLIWAIEKKKKKKILRHWKLMRLPALLRSHQAARADCLTWRCRPTLMMIVLSI